MHDVVCAECGQNVKSLSNQTQVDQYIVVTVGLKDEIREEVDIKLIS